MTVATDLRAKQRSVVVQIVLGVLGIAVVGGAAYALVPLPHLPGTADRLVYALRWAVLPTLMLLAGITTVALSRFADDAAIDPTTRTEKGAIVVHGRYTDNTQQQLVLHLVATFSLAARGGAIELRSVPALTACFVVGRALFWIGYLQHPLRRGPGFTMTFYPTVAALLYVAGMTVSEALR